MKFIDQLKAFGEQSAGVLDAKEQAMYLRLFLIDNALGWPEWFAVSVSQLKRELRAGSHHTVVAAKRSLEKNGFIQTKNDNRTGITWFKIIELGQASTMAENAIGKKCHRQKMPKTRAENALVLGQKMPTSKDSKTVDNSVVVVRARTREEDLAEVIRLFSDNIHPVTGEIELDTLASFVDDYGKEWTLSAIREAAANAGRSVRYVNAILENWKRDGHKTEGGTSHGASYRRGARRNPSEAPAARRKPGSTSFAAAAYRPHPWDVPGQGCEGGRDPSEP